MLSRFSLLPTRRSTIQHRRKEEGDDILGVPLTYSPDGTSWRKTLRKISKEESTPPTQTKNTIILEQKEISSIICSKVWVSYETLIIQYYV